MAATVLIIGAGLSGESVLRYFLARHKTCMLIDEKISNDRRRTIEKEYGITVQQQTLDQPLGNVLPPRDVSMVVVSPGVAPQRELIATARQQGIPITNDIALFCRAAQAPIIGITGSNGKSGTCLLLSTIFAQSGVSSLIGGNYGIPALELLNQAIPDYYILELSSFQLELAREYHVAVGVILNICDDHLDRHGSFDAYRSCKHSLLDHAHAKVVPHSHQQLGITKDDKTITFSYDDIAALPLRQIGFDQKPLPLLSSLVVVAAIFEALGKEIPYHQLDLSHFEGLPHRFEMVVSIDGVRYINDSKGTNPGCVIQALEALPYPVITILGGETKQADVTPLRAACQGKVIFSALFGQDAEKFSAMLAPIGIPTHRCNSVPEAVQYTSERAVSGDTILFSPGGASFDCYPGGFAERGQDFCRAVYQQL